MMKTKVAFFILFLSLCVSAQTHRFIYDVEFRKDSTSKVTTKQNYHLDITGDEVLYYSRDYFTADSLIKNNIPFPADLKLSTSTILKHKKGISTFNEYDLLESTVLDLQTKDVQIWTLTNEKKQLDNLTLQKATTTWGARNWIAWFAKDIPFQEGPYKFHGLPGMIVEVSDDQNNYKFSRAKSENFEEYSEDQIMAYAVEISIPVTWEKFKATKLKFYESPVGFMKNANGRSGSSDFFLNDGTVVSAANAREINERLRKNMKTFNNPIELDKLILYP